MTTKHYARLSSAFDQQAGVLCPFEIKRADAANHVSWYGMIARCCALSRSSESRAANVLIEPGLCHSSINLALCPQDLLPPNSGYHMNLQQARFQLSDSFADKLDAMYKQEEEAPKQ